MIEETGIEPACFCSQSKRHIQWPTPRWSKRRGSNPRRSAWKAEALPAELLLLAIPVQLSVAIRAKNVALFDLCFYLLLTKSCTSYCRHDVHVFLTRISMVEIEDRRVVLTAFFTFSSVRSYPSQQPPFAVLRVLNILIFILYVVRSVVCGLARPTLPVETICLRPIGCELIHLFFNTTLRTSLLIHTFHYNTAWKARTLPLSYSRVCEIHPRIWA